jgi:spore coat polysaccharide biosynthesis protein SpsF
MKKNVDTPDNHLIITVVVQARMASNRLHGKVMLPILGETLLYRMIERLKQIKYPVQIVVATSTNEEDQIIEKFCQKKKITFYAGELNDLLDRHYQIGVLTGSDVVIKIPSDCPLIDPQIVDKVIQFYLENEGKYDFVSNLHPATYPDGNDVELMTFEALEKAWKEAQRPLEREHTTPYFWENDDKFKNANVIWESGLDYSMTHRFTIDYDDDYLFIKRVFEELYPINPNFSMGDILNLIVIKPEIYNLNRKYAGVNWYRNHLNELNTIEATQTKEVPS